jgi:hypothetical protein
VANLLAERQRLEERIAAVRAGHLETLSDAQALERIGEIVALADGLAGDFRRVRDDFERLNRATGSCGSGRRISTGRICRC